MFADHSDWTDVYVAGALSLFAMATPFLYGWYKNLAIDSEEQQVKWDSWKSKLLQSAGEGPEVVMTASRKNGVVTMRLERVPRGLVDYRRVHHVAGGPYKGILINKTAEDQEDVEPEEGRLEFMAYLSDEKNEENETLQDYWLLKFWFQGQLDGIAKKKAFTAYFQELMNPKDFPKNYIGFIKRALILLSQYSSIRRIELKVRELEIVEELPPIKSFVTVYTPNSYSYQFVPEVAVNNKSFLTFKVKALADAHLSLCAVYGDVDRKTIEVVIGADNNTSSKIREGSMGPVRAEANTPGIIKDAEFRYFWVSWTDNCIQVGRGARCGRNHIMSWEIPDHKQFNVNCLAVATSHASKGQWEFAELLEDFPKMDVPEAATKRRYIPGKASRHSDVIVRTTNNQYRSQWIIPNRSSSFMTSSQRRYRRPAEAAKDRQARYSTPITPGELARAKVRALSHEPVKRNDAKHRSQNKIDVNANLTNHDSEYFETDLDISRDQQYDRLSPERPSSPEEGLMVSNRRSQKDSEAQRTRSDRIKRAKDSLLWLAKGQKMLYALEDAYPNSLPMDVLLRSSRIQQTDMITAVVMLKDLEKKDLIREMAPGIWMRVQSSAELTKHEIQMVDQLPQVERQDQPAIAIISALYLEKLAVDSMIEDKRTFVKYKKEGESSISLGESQVYTLGRIGPHRVVSTKLSRVGSARDVMLSAENTTTRLLGIFNQVEHVLLVGVGGAVPHYTDFKEHVRLGDVVVSLPVDDSGAQYLKIQKVETIRGIDGYSYMTRSYQCIDNTLHQVVQKLKKTETLTGAAPWIAYLDEAKHILKGEETSFYRPPVKTDRLFITRANGERIEIRHPIPEETEAKRHHYEAGQPMVKYGLIAAGKIVSRSFEMRSEFSQTNKVKAFDTEFDPVLESLEGNRNESFLIIRGMTDYGDGSIKEWQPYASLVAAAYMKAVIMGLKSKAPSEDEVDVKISNQQPKIVKKMPVPIPRQEEFGTTV